MEVGIFLEKRGYILSNKINQSSLQDGAAVGNEGMAVGAAEGMAVGKAEGEAVGAAEGETVGA